MPTGIVLLGTASFLVGSLLFGGLGRFGLCGGILVSYTGALGLILGVRVFLDEDFAK
jgi:hypothetical protein